jgi:DNA replication protein
MSEFKGFPVRMQYTPLPNLFFSALLPEIGDMNELKTVLHVFEILYSKKGKLHFTTLNELSVHPGVIASLEGPAEQRQEELKQALESAVQRGILLRLDMLDEEKPQIIYLLNNETNRLALPRLKSGEIVLEGLKSRPEESFDIAKMPDLFTLYEQNIGMLTPIIAEELQDWKEHYPENWIKDAIREAVDLNKRSPRYIERILERWSSEGKGDGTYRGNLKKNSDPDKYIRGKYGHIVRR